ncbi:luciferin sulfotransferase-like [Venturia canescens]|uniref:luciferin sulfotransferase-like n=1 Tax=Venturia canescens TaxID=32260 RepID=UPI001C9C1076|nr:luciferin sulfotransferase-like [Venturia canescens]
MPEETECEDVDRLLRETFTNEFRTGYINLKGFCLPAYYKKFANSIENFEVRDDDVWVCSFPKSGTTWTQEMVWCIANNLDFEAAKVVLSERFPFFEHSALFDYTTILSRMDGFQFPELVEQSVSYVDKLPSPRFIKSHLPFDLLPRQIREGMKKPKIIYVARNAKDTCISYYNHCKLLEGYHGNFEDFCTLFLAGKLCFAPFWKHVLGFWTKRNNENVLFLKYEDMKEDLASVIRETAHFLGKSKDGTYDNDEKMQPLLEHLSFESMKNNSAVNYEDVVDVNRKLKLIEADGKFMRSGQKDQWKSQMAQEVIEKFDNFTRTNFHHTGLSFL